MLELVELLNGEKKGAKVATDVAVATDTFDVSGGPDELTSRALDSLDSLWSLRSFLSGDRCFEESFACWLRSRSELAAAAAAATAALRSDELGGGLGVSWLLDHSVALGTGGGVGCTTGFATKAMRSGVRWVKGRWGMS